MYRVSTWESDSEPYEVGDLVKYYETYADGIVKGTGTGIILSAHVYQIPYKEGEGDPATERSVYGGYRTPLIEAYSSAADSLPPMGTRIYGNRLNYYMVYRFGARSTAWYEDHDLDIISKANDKRASKATAT